jgi:hypothetical protein
MKIAKHQLNPGLSRVQLFFREEILDARAYADLIEKHLNSCQNLETRPHFPSRITIPLDNPKALYWKDRILLQNGLVLEVHEQAFFDDEGMSERSFSYDFREEAGRRLIWRIDNHCRLQSVEAPCHVHRNPNNEGERFEYFTDSKKADFMYAMHCVKNYYQSKPQEWEVAENDALS